MNTCLCFSIKGIGIVLTLKVVLIRMDGELLQTITTNVVRNAWCAPSRYTLNFCFLSMNEWINQQSISGTAHPSLKKIFQFTQFIIIQFSLFLAGLTIPKTIQIVQHMPRDQKKNQLSSCNQQGKLSLANSSDGITARLLNKVYFVPSLPLWMSDATISTLMNCIHICFRNP